MSREPKERMRVIIEEYKAGFYQDSRVAARDIAKVINQAADKGQQMAWFMVLLDDAISH